MSPGICSTEGSRWQNQLPLDHIYLISVASNLVELTLK